MKNGICPNCGIDLDALSMAQASRMLRDPITGILELSRWAGPPPGRLGPLRNRLRRKGVLGGAWWDDMSCEQRTQFLRTRLIPEGFGILFPEPMLTSVIHSDWEQFNREMRVELESIRR